MDLSAARPGARDAVVVIVVAALFAGALSFGAARRASATFDEIVLVAGGVRGLETGHWEMITDQPPLMLYLYGAAARGAADTLPAEDRDWLFEDRWDYARSLIFGSGNDASRLLARARAVSVFLAMLTVAAAGGFAWWIAGPAAGALAAVVTAFLPDVLAHGGVAYNDLPLALFFLAAVWAIDAFVRRPSPVRGAVAAAAVAAALCTKLSALALGPIGIALLAVEGWSRRRDPAWRRDFTASAVVAVATLYVALVVLYRGDPTLTLLRFNFWRTVSHTTAGHAAPAFLMGGTSPGGWWYYFPVAFLFKTPAAFQALLAVGAAMAGRSFLGSGPSGARLLAWRGRAAVVGVVVFGGFLMRSDLNAGFRYGLPVLPLLAVLVGVTFARPWACCARAKRVLFGGLFALQGVSVLTAYPYLIAYSSVWAGGRDDAYRSLADSNVDWGQGLLDLRRFMAEEGVGSVRLSYFGSAPPEAYGIEYVALPSFFRLGVARTAGAEASPRFTVISANNLLGLYLQGRDPFAAYRARAPYRVLGHALFIFDDAGGGEAGGGNAVPPP